MMVQVKHSFMFHVAVEGKSIIESELHKSKQNDRVSSEGAGSEDSHFNTKL